VLSPLRVPGGYAKYSLQSLEIGGHNQVASVPFHEHGSAQPRRIGKVRMHDRLEADRTTEVFGKRKLEVVCQHMR
jgi:hypothetical protein